jgi:hypothetical protein
VIDPGVSIQIPPPTPAFVRAAEHGMSAGDGHAAEEDRAERNLDDAASRRLRNRRRPPPAPAIVMFCASQLAEGERVAARWQRHRAAVANRGHRLPQRAVRRTGTCSGRIVGRVTLSRAPSAAATKSHGAERGQQNDGQRDEPDRASQNSAT